MTVNPEEPPIISFRDVGMSFGASPVFDGLDLDIRRGEFVSIIGPSGCGKSTVLRLGSGLTEPSSGSIDRSTDNVGYVFQDATLMPWRTVRRNVELLGKLDKMPADELTRRVDAALETVGLAQYSHLLPRQLSGGMRMRASLSCARSTSPPRRPVAPRRGRPRRRQGMFSPPSGASPGPRSDCCRPPRTERSPPPVAPR
ncbi:ATP-binding cassette domain-containing protein [Microbacterium aquimaris]|uniref:ATP-binding cassette domain-containing protein n=1 Tax=Microbacterium aquimaris TaxID=459816 RepID=UPI002AD3789F|nr:ATP-binding cassette domain-containing protein [Microbacterium aquimaris]MDZ8275160.1 ATP-binding cassette domain-containing protein [Microbacterium aquimaris]